MKIAFDISPLSTGHKYRGTGFYTLHLKEALEKYFPQHEYTFFTDKKDIPQNVDVIHYPYFDPFSLSIPLSYAKKTIVTVLDLTPIVFPKAFPAGIRGNLFWQLQKRSLGKIAGIVTDSISAKNDIVRLTGIRNEKISVAYLAAGEGFTRFKILDFRIKEMQKKYHLPEKFALYVGDVTWNKNLPRIVEAAKDANIPLIIVGKALVEENYDRAHPWNQDLVKVQSIIKTTTNIRAVGFVPDEDLVALYNMATVCVMPSLYEGFGLPILEAMACGCPVVTSSEGSLSEVAGDGAYFVDPRSVESITKGLQEVFSSSVLQKSLSQKGLVQAKKFSWKKTAEETIQAYEKIHSKI